MFGFRLLGEKGKRGILQSSQPARFEMRCRLLFIVDKGWLGENFLGDRLDNKVDKRSSKRFSDDLFLIFEGGWLC